MKEGFNSFIAFVLAVLLVIGFLLATKGINEAIVQDCYNKGGEWVLANKDTGVCVWRNR